MSNEQDYNWIFDRDYCGRILKATFSIDLKKRVAETLGLFRNFNVNANPTIPYISAWRENDDKSIWYEFAGKRLLKLLDCEATEAAETFRDSVRQRISFYHEPDKNKVYKKILSQDDLIRLQDELRNEGKKNRTIEAVYKVSLKDKSPIWLKDQAFVEFFQKDDICLVCGTLTDITMEMKAEEQEQIEKAAMRARQAELERKIEKQCKDLWKMQLEMIYRLAQGPELQDRDTGPHITKMSHYCNILAEAAGVSTEERRLIFHAMATRDVGKLGISDSILHKPGDLTDLEFAIIKNHSIIGAKLLSGNGTPLLQKAREIALTHHERWDGAGYPAGLKQEEIPLAGRIAAICDVFDALTSTRPYKRAWNAEEAFAELETESGSKFDPQLTSLFLKEKNAIMEVQQHFSDKGEIRLPQKTIALPGKSK